MRSPLPPLHVAIAASFALMAGMFSLVGFIAGFLNGHPTFDVGMFAILFGWGLLCGKRGVKNWMIVFSLIFFLGSVIPAAIITWPQVSGKEPWVPLDTPRDLIAAVIIATVSLYTFLVLLSIHHKAWFHTGEISEEQRAIGREAARFIAFPVLAVSLVLAAFLHLGQWWSNETLRGAYPLNVRVVGYDEETGERLNIVSGPDHQQNESRRERVKLPQYSIGIRAEPEGDHAISVRTIDGVFNRPFEFTLITSGDYEPATVKLNRDSPEEIPVPMKRKK